MASSNKETQLLMNFSLTTTVSPSTLAEDWMLVFLIAWLINIPMSSIDRQLGKIGYNSQNEKR